jgi:hypothetical protein
MLWGGWTQTGEAEDAPLQPPDAGREGGGPRGCGADADTPAAASAGAGGAGGGQGSEETDSGGGGDGDVRGI